MNGWTRLFFFLTLFKKHELNCDSITYELSFFLSLNLLTISLIPIYVFNTHFDLLH